MSEKGGKTKKHLCILIQKEGRSGPIRKEKGVTCEEGEEEED